MDTGKYIAERVYSVPFSEIREMLKQVKQIPDAVNLTIGEPDFEPFEPIKKAIVRALYEPSYKGAPRPCAYPPGSGIYELREEIAKKVKRENGIEVSPNEIVITNGAEQGLFLSLLAILNPGEEILLPDPAFITYAAIARVISAIPTYYPLYEENEFRPTREDIEKNITEKTKAILINSPHNPTGAVYTKKDLEEIADLAVEHDLIIISDEPYEKFIYDGGHISIASLGEEIKVRTISVFSFSKTYGATGLRLGYTIAPIEIARHLGKLLLYNTSGVCAPIQAAGIEALKCCENDIKNVIREYKERRDFVHKRLSEMPDIRCVKPRGAFYIFPYIGEYGTSKEFAQNLLSTAHVGVVPGSAYGAHGEGYIRIYLAKKELLEEGMNRMEKALTTLKRRGD